MRPIIHLGGWYSPIVGTTLNFLHPISRFDCPIISHYQPPPPSFLDVCRFALQGPFMDLVGLLVKVKKPSHNIVATNTNN